MDTGKKMLWCAHTGVDRPSKRRSQYSVGMWAGRTSPWAGKARVALELASRRPERALSASTVGRILAKGVKDGRVPACSFCEGRVKAKRQRGFDDSHAERWTRDDWHVGVQADHMTPTADGKAAVDMGMAA